MPTTSPPRGPEPHRLPLSDSARPDSPWIHPPSSVRFLQRWDRLQADACQRYDDSGWNVSVRYAFASSLVVSAYVYPSPHGLDADRLLFARSVRDMLRSLSDPREIEESVVAFARAGGDVVRGRYVSAIGTPHPPGASPCRAVIQQFTQGGWLIKLRMTCTPRLETLAERFMGEWLRASAFGLHRSPLPSTQSHCDD